MTTTLDALERGDLAGARRLRLAGGLTALPRAVFGLADSLELLDLSGNALTTLPDDFGRLHKLQVLFCSGNRFTRLPPVLGDCPALSQMGFRGTGLQDISGEALPPGLRWLTVTDNQLTALPDAIGQRPALQKLMLAGNRLRQVPPALAHATNLELLRLSANAFDTLPPWLTKLPRLAWLAWAGNGLDQGLGALTTHRAIDWASLQPGALLGEGASGRVHEAVWQDGAAAQPVALKLFKGAMTSDGLPEREMAACLEAGAHPNLLTALGRLTGHPDGMDGLVLPLLPAHWRVLAGPPSLESCSRDVYEPGLRMDLAVAIRIAAAVGAAAAHLHGRGLLHGDLYAHNTLWDGASGAAVLSDFGAASFLPPGADALSLQRIEVRAWGLLLGELLDHTYDAPAALRTLQQQCTTTDVNSRPLLTDAVAVLQNLEVAEEGRQGLCP